MNHDKRWLLCYFINLYFLNYRYAIPDNLLTGEYLKGFTKISEALTYFYDIKNLD